MAQGGRPWTRMAWAACHGEGICAHLIRLAALQLLLLRVLPGRCGRLLRSLLAWATLAAWRALELRHMGALSAGLHAAAHGRLAAVQLPELEEWVARGERAVAGLRMEHAKNIIWADPSRRARTALAVVYIHGWSASCREATPLCEEIAREHGANLYFARLPGHGLEMMGYGRTENMGVTAFLREAVEAFAIGERLGERVLLVGLSLGALLAAWLGAQPFAQRSLRGSVFVSLAARFPIVPLSMALSTVPLLSQALLPCQYGFTYHVPIESAADAEIYTHSCPSRVGAVVFELQALLPYVDRARCTAPVLAFQNPGDTVQSFRAGRAYVRSLPNSRFEVLVPGPGEESHVITSQVYAPSTMPKVLAAVRAWLDSTEATNGSR
eukprot:NODE_8843_length_1466_cov_2.083645.p1 GENE.NODE_8843_length_1466_cov_2.083645~~NODE_8843_length_1466_cov_2.083645.p1  ORF type:complete len:382 (-),score=115.84 NODE_8843_length_1466_cov_2.083645:247-1392(-)